jgi:hypothetical protein
MSARNQRSRGPVRAQRRERIWVENDRLDTIAAGAALNLDLCAATNEDAFTIIRTIIRIQVQNWAAVADLLAFGLLVGRAVDIGSTPVLASMPGLDWSWKGSIEPTFSGATVNAGSSYDVDSKSRRKVRELDERYLLCYTNGSAASKNVLTRARTLIMLP